MELLEAILTRRSIRRFEERPVPEELIKDVLAAAMSAPSAGNEQPWHFIVITDRAMLENVAQINPNAGMAAHAALAILVCADLNLERYGGFWVLDCAAASQNLLLAAHDRGLGAVWTGIYPIPERVEGYKKLFELPKNIIPLALIPLGYPDQQLPRNNNFKQERVHINKW